MNLPFEDDSRYDPLLVIGMVSVWVYYINNYHVKDPIFFVDYTM